MRQRAMNQKPARRSRAMVLSLTLGVSFLALWVFGSNIILKVARMIDEPVTKQVAMEVVIPVAMPASPREAPPSTVAQTDWPSEPATAEPAAAEPVGPNSVVWEPLAPNPAEAVIAFEQSASSDRSTSLPAQGVPEPGLSTSEQTPPPAPSKIIVAKAKTTTPSPAESVEAAPLTPEPAAASEPLVPKPVKTVAAESQVAPSLAAPVVVASAETGIEARWPGRLVARAVEGGADETAEQSSVPLPPTRRRVRTVSVPLPTPRPVVGTSQRSAAAGRVLTDADVRIQEMHF